MAISRFDTPADYTPINTYVPLPYQELAQGLLIKQKRYDDNEEMQFKLENLIKTIKADPNRQFMLKELDDEYFSKIDDLASTIHDKGDMRYKSELRKIAGKFQTDDRVRNLNTSYANHLKYQEDSIKNKEKMTDFYDSYKQDAQSIEQMKKAGITTPTFNYNGMLYKQDYVKDMDDLVKGIAKDGLAKEGYLTYPKGHPQAGELMINGYGQYTKNGRDYEGVSVAKVKQIANLSVDPFLGKESSRYFVDQLYGKQVNYDKLTPEQKTNVRTVAAQTMQQIAAKQVFADTKQTTDLRNLSEYATGKLENANQQVLSETFLTEKYDSGNESKSPLDGLEFDESGQLKVPSKNEFDLDTKGKISDNPLLAISRTSFTPKKDTEKYKEQKAKLDEVIKNNPGFESKTPKEAAEIYNAAVKNNSQISTPYKDIRGAANKYYTEQVFKGDLNTRGISLIMSKGGSSKTQGLSQISKTLDLDEKELRAQMKESRVNGIMNGEKPGMFTATVLDGGGNKVTVGITPSVEQGKHFTRSWAAGKLQRENKVGVNPFQDPVDGKWYIAQTFIDPNTQQFKTIVVDAKKDKEGVEIAPNANAYDENALFEQDDVRWKNTDYYPKNKEVKSPVVYSNEDSE